VVALCNYRHCERPTGAWQSTLFLTQSTLFIVYSLARRGKQTACGLFIPLYGGVDFWTNLFAQKDGVVYIPVTI
jgi:hypothetical protein